MAGTGQNRWIVLLNRSPKGPLTEEEVRTLLNQGILRQNDIAYLVSADGDKSKSEWKLLWQFPEFNRRLPADAPKAQPANVTLDKERRQKIPPEEIQKKTLGELPPELMEITPEDLLPKSTGINFKPEPEKINALADEALLKETPPESSLHFDFRWAYGAAGIAVLSLIVMNWPMLTHKSGARPSMSRQEEHAPSTAEHPAIDSSIVRQNQIAPPRSNARPPVAGNRPMSPPPPQAEERRPSDVESSYDTPKSTEEERGDEEKANAPPAESEEAGKKAKAAFRNREGAASDEVSPASEPENEKLREQEESGSGPPQISPGSGEIIQPAIGEPPPQNN